MIRREVIRGHAQIARVYPGAEAGPSAAYIASYIIEWVSPREAWIKAFKGVMTRTMFREVLTDLIALEIHTILARRGDCHRLWKLGTEGEDGITYVDVRALAHRFASPGTSNWIDLDD